MVGQTLGHYKVLEKLGEGGMGEVYRAVDVTLDRHVALKFLPVDLASDSDRLDRFEREAKTLAALNHPNIVTIHSVEEVDGVHFLAMELVEGKPLDQSIPTSGMSLARLFEIAIPLSEALTAAHEQGIIHRDLKPANIMVSRDGTVKVLDFGLAKLHHKESGPDLSEMVTEPLTQEGLVVGTIPYMSPEQLEGRDLDSRSDIFSLGIILYEMATGQRPFRGESSVAILSSIVRDSPEEIDRIRDDLPHQLARIVRHCLEKNPENRFQTSRDVRNELKDLLSEDESGLHSSALGARPDRPSSKRLQILALLVFVALTASLAIWKVAGRSSPPPTRDARDEAVPRIMVLPFENLGRQEDEYFADGITEEITSRLSAVSGLRVISRTTAAQYKHDRPPLTEIGRDLNVGYVLEGSVRWATPSDGKARVRITPQLIQVRDDSQIWSATYDRVVDDIFAIQSDLAQQVLAALDIALSETERQGLELQPTRDLAAYRAYLEGKQLLRQPHFTLESWNQALASLERAVELDPDFAFAWAELARGHSRLIYFKVDPSEERLELAQRAMKRAVAGDPQAPEVRLATGFYHLWALRDAQGAYEAFLAAARLSPRNIDVLEGLGETARLQGHIEEAISYYREATEISPLDASPLVELGLSQWWAREFEDALETCDRAIAVAPGGTWPYFTKALNYWGWKGYDPRAREALEAVTHEHPWLPWLWYWQEIYSGRYRQAIERLADSGEDWIVLKHCIRPRPLLESYALELLGESEKARVASERAVTMLEERLLNSPGEARLHASLGIGLAQLGNKDEAVRAGKRGVELFPISTDAIYAQLPIQDLAHIHVLVGDYESACHELAFLLSIPGVLSTPMMEVDPRWSRLREQDCYRRLLEAPPAS